MELGQLPGDVLAHISVFLNARDRLAVPMRSWHAALAASPEHEAKLEVEKKKLHLVDEDIDEQPLDAVTLTHVAAASGCLTHLNTLRDTLPKDCATIPLFLAAREGHLAMVVALLGDGDADGDGDDCVIAASAMGHARVLRVLLSDERRDPSFRDNLALKLALLNAHVEVVALLLNDARLDLGFSTDIFGLAISGPTSDWIVEWLIGRFTVDGKWQPGCYRHLNNEYGRGACGDIAVRQILSILVSDKRVKHSSHESPTIRPGSIWNSGHQLQSDPMIWAAARGFLETVQMLLNDGRFHPGNAIITAASGGHLEIVRLLVTDSRVATVLSGLNVNCVSQALIEAAKNSRLDVVRFFMSHHHPPRDAVMQSIEKAAESGHDAIVDFFVSRSGVFLPDDAANKETTDFFLNHTIFMIAAKHYRVSVLKKLMANQRFKLQPPCAYKAITAARVTVARIVQHLQRTDTDRDGMESYMRQRIARATTLIDYLEYVCKVVPHVVE